jgi:hypothetical protein
MYVVVKCALENESGSHWNRNVLIGLAFVASGNKNEILSSNFVLIMYINIVLLYQCERCNR